MSGICTAPVYKMEELHNIFMILTKKNCNQRCKNCYIDFPLSKKIKDFISIDLIKESLNDTRADNLQCIYLTGAEPMTHPDFNAILRLCLKRCNVCICTNGSFLNEKKIRFLKKVEDEGLNKWATQIFFRLSLTHYDEMENDKSKYRGNYRQTIFALKTLSRYNFTSVLAIQNVYNVGINELTDSFENIFQEHGISDVDLQINSSFSENIPVEIRQSCSTDCMHGRAITEEGVFSCPFLAGDYRGRCGSSFKNFSKNVLAESDFCQTCSLNNKPMFTIG